MSDLKNVVVFTGAGVSAESGLKTFRDSDGLWEEHDIQEVATPEAWEKNQAMVMDFYNHRRKQVLESQPNKAHLELVKLEEKFNVQIITQNIDDLHERAGSKNVLHLHGEIRKIRSSTNPGLIYELEDWELKEGMLCDHGSQLRPHIVWFGEAVPEMDKACEITSKADIMLIIGTSLSVYPAANLIHYAHWKAFKYLIDPQPIRVTDVENLEHIQKPASEGVEEVVSRILKGDL